MFLLYPWLRLFKCCRCLTLDDREGEEATIRKMKKKREKKKREEADKHREFQRRLEEKKRKEEEEWLERSGLNDFLEDDDKGDIFDTDFNNGKSKKDGIEITYVTHLQHSLHSLVDILLTTISFIYVFLKMFNIMQ